MSADNGIYILVTPVQDGESEVEYRVAHLQAVEDIEWGRCSIHGSDFRFGNDGRENCQECRVIKPTDDPGVQIQNARERWGNARRFARKGEALEFASDVLAGLDICEYGISFIHIPRRF